MRLIIGFVCLLSSTLAGAQQWQWTAPCQFDGQNPRCSMWPASIEPLGEVKVFSGDTALTVESQTFSTASMLFMQADKVTTITQKAALIKALLAFVKAQQANQKVGLYANDVNLNTLASLGANQASLVGAIDDMRLPTRVVSPVNNLKLVTSILGGSNAQRKTLYWVTTGSVLSATEQQVLLNTLTQEKVRLVVIYLKTSELDQNAGAAIASWLGDTPHFLVPATGEQWLSVFTQLAVYTLNGVTLAVNSEQMCGELPITFKSTLGQTAISHVETFAFNACAVVQEVPPETEEPVLTEDQTPTSDGSPEKSTPSKEAEEETMPLVFEQPAYSFSFDVTATGETLIGSVRVNEVGSSDVVSYSLSSGNENGNFLIKASGDLFLSPLASVLVENDYEALDEAYTLTITATAGSAKGSAVVTVRKMAAPALSNNMMVALIVAGVLLLLVLLFMLIRGGKGKSKLTPFGYIIESTLKGEVSHPLFLEVTRLGRAQSCNIVFTNDSVSSSHADIKRERTGAVTIVDLKSSNGTRVNNNTVNHAELKSGDMVELGDYKLKVELN
jgi:hypothetical protein